MKNIPSTTPREEMKKAFGELYNEIINEFNALIEEVKTRV